MGVLIGTSLIVIIPEGVDTLYTASRVRHRRPNRPVFNGPSTPIDFDPGSSDNDDNDKGLFNDPIGNKIKRALNSIANTLEIYERNSEDAKIDRIITPPNVDEATHKYVGVSLIAGFIMMYLIDKLPSILSSNQSAQSFRRHESVDVAELQTFSGNGSGLPTEEGYAMASAPGQGSPQSGAGSLTSGLVIHATADGIALGASAASSSVALETIVFIAIMIHKAPAAFGMSAVLLRGGVPRSSVRKYLLIFSLAAPLGALVTWTAIMFIGANDGVASVQWWTGIILLFSGGTFLYVAVHVMNDSEHEEKSSGQMAALKDTIAAVTGMLIPLVTLAVKDV